MQDSARIDMRLFRDHMPPKLRREVENMYATSDEEDDDDEEEGCEGTSSDEEAGSAGADGHGAVGHCPLLAATGLAPLLVPATACFKA